MTQDKLRFGAAYYDEYMPCERLEQDMKMMVEAGFNTIRIAESTWSTSESRPGKYEFSLVDMVLDETAYQVTAGCLDFLFYLLYINFYSHKKCKTSPLYNHPVL